MNAPQDQLIAARLLGTWRLVENSRWEDGNPIDREHIGPAPRGMINYSGDGCVMVVITRSDRPQMSGGRYSSPSAEQSDAWASSNAYAGRYTCSDTTVVHHIDINTFENDVSTDYVRQVEFVEGDLVLSTPAATVGGKTQVMKLRWRRVN